MRGHVCTCERVHMATAPHAASPAIPDPTTDRDDLGEPVADSLTLALQQLIVRADNLARAAMDVRVNDAAARRQLARIIGDYRRQRAAVRTLSLALGGKGVAV